MSDVETLLYFFQAKPERRWFKGEVRRFKVERASCLLLPASERTSWKEARPTFLKPMRFHLNSSAQRFEQLLNS